MAFSLTGLNVDKISENGGHELQVEGVFEVGQPYEVYIGDTMSISDTPCYSAKPEQGDTIYPWTSTILRCYTPTMPPDVLMTVTVKNMNTSETHQLIDSLTTTYQQFQSTVFSIRKVLPLFYKTGPRDIEAVPPVA